MKKAELIFLPSPGLGHLASTTSFATQLLDRDCRFSVTILLIIPPSDETSKPLPPSKTDRLRYLHLPPIHPPPPELFSKSIEKYISVWMQSYITHVKNVILNHVLSSSSSTTDPPPTIALVLDFFLSMMIDVGQELGIPSFVFFTSNAAFYGFMSFLGIRHQRVLVGFEESSDETESIIPSFINPLSIKSFPSFAFNKDGGFTSMMEHALNFKKAKGIIINTFAELDSHAVNSFSAGHGNGNPPIYTVGPILDFKREYRPSSNQNQNRDIMAWLDDQPPSSVVFLCFGSYGSFSEPQIKEIANGLQNSGIRFVWSIRRRPENNMIEASTNDNDDFKDLLPDGFWERNKGKGMICGWVSQIDILGHEAIGGFISHCGWNSVLESIWFGVPIIAWPLYAEQKINAFELVKDLGMVVEMKIEYRMEGGDMVSADQIERAVRSVMENDSEVRKKVAEMSEKSRQAVVEGGSSYHSVGRLINDIFLEVTDINK